MSDLRTRRLGLVPLAARLRKGVAEEKRLRGVLAQLRKTHVSLWAAANATRQSAPVLERALRAAGQRTVWIRQADARLRNAAEVRLRQRDASLVELTRRKERVTQEIAALAAKRRTEAAEVVAVNRTAVQVREANQRLAGEVSDLEAKAPPLILADLRGRVKAAQEELQRLQAQAGRAPALHVDFRQKLAEATEQGLGLEQEARSEEEMRRQLEQDVVARRRQLHLLQGETGDTELSQSTQAQWQAARALARENVRLRAEADALEREATS